MTWQLTRINVERVYEVSDVPDLQDTSSSRRRIVRPRKVKLHQVSGTNLIRGATIEGRQVRRDGELAGSVLVCAGHRRQGFYQECVPPKWLETILTDEGLEWVSE